MNRLKDETSPYLLQHAHNPVDWYPWGEEALQKARDADKPILVSIGYSACHWCHVMERESFENEETARLMNEHFINIKIDREERPDLDHIYMDAVQAMSGSGGWPLNVFLTPDARPFYGGTYFPPQRVGNRPAWSEILIGISNAYRDKKEEITAQADTLTSHILKSNDFGLQAEREGGFTKEKADLIFRNLMKSADKADGGFGRAPKFPQTFSIQYLLRYGQLYKSDEALTQACLSLDKMIYGGIYDQLGGGFARYSTDSEWLAPHFEKMLYDNALLVIVLSDAYKITRKELYKKAILETMEFVEREMISDENGFFAALDADSEGVEGKFYVWDEQETSKILGEDARIFNSFYDIKEGGNWEHVSIMRVLVSEEKFAADKGISLEGLSALLERGKKKLMAVRNGRVRPGLDDKILLSWNAMMNTACSKAFAATGEERFRQLAKKNMEFIWKVFRKEGGGFFHTYKNGKAGQPVFLDDLASLIQALIALQEVTGIQAYLLQARECMDLATAEFGEEDTGFFFFTGREQKDVIVRKKEVYDGAVPSGNAQMAGNLLYLSGVFDRKEWKERAIRMVGSLEGAITAYPGSFGVWAGHVLSLVSGMKEIIITGTNFNEIHFDILHNFIPSCILQVSAYPDETFPLLRGKDFTHPVLIYVCENYTCNPPVSSLSGLVQQLEN